MLARLRMLMLLPSRLPSEYMCDVLHIPAEECRSLCAATYGTNGTTFAGLVEQGHIIDADHWHAFVHGRIQQSAHLKPDPELRRLLLSLPQRKYIFTNADDKHAEACLRVLGVHDLFLGIITFESLQRVAAARGSSAILCKPAPEAFLAALELAGAVAESTLFCDDSLRNVAGAAEVGIAAVVVGTAEMCPGAVAAVLDIRHLHAAVPMLWTAAAPAEEAPAEEALEHGEAIEVLA